MNSFFASVELLEHPELNDLPVAIAGDPEKRHGIILAKNDAAKKYGVITAETLQSALRKCPMLRLLSPHHEKYRYYSKRINRIYLEYTDLVQPFSIDESWLDVTASEKLFGNAENIANEIRARIKENFGLTLSAGVSFNKIFAKMGSEYKKPDATTVISPSNFRSILWPLSVSEFFFVGRRGADRLKAIGINTIGQLAQADRNLLADIFGTHGYELSDYANGLEDSPVTRYGEERKVKSIGHGTTFSRNIIGRDDISLALTDLADNVSSRMRYRHLVAGGIRVEITDPAFKRVSKQKRVSRTLKSSADIKEAAMSLVEELKYLDRPIRLITVTVINLKSEESAEQITILSLLSPSSDNSGRNRDIDSAIDEIRSKYGRGSITFAHALDNDIGIDSHKERGGK